MRTLILNQSNIVPQTNNSTLLYRFPAGAIQIKKGQKMSFSSASLYNSTFNITATYKNNSFSYTWVDGTIVNIIVPDGYYSIETLQLFLQFIMVQNKHYIVTSTGSFIYFITLSLNVSAYAVELNCFGLNTAIATSGGWTLPVGSLWVIPTNFIVPIFTVLNNNFQYIIGFNPGNYPDAIITGIPPAQIESPVYTSTQIFLSTFTPQVSLVLTYILTCSLINNNYAVPNTLLYSFSPSGAFGA